MLLPIPSRLLYGLYMVGDRTCHVPCALLSTTAATAPAVPYNILDYLPHTHYAVRHDLLLPTHFCQLSSTTATAACPGVSHTLGAGLVATNGFTNLPILITFHVYHRTYQYDVYYSPVPALHTMDVSTWRRRAFALHLPLPYLPT